MATSCWAVDRLNKQGGVDGKPKTIHGYKTPKRLVLGLGCMNKSHIQYFHQICVNLVF